MYVFYNFILITFALTMMITINLSIISLFTMPDSCMLNVFKSLLIFYVKWLFAKYMSQLSQTMGKMHLGSLLKRKKFAFILGLN